MGARGSRTHVRCYDLYEEAIYLAYESVQGRENSNLCVFFTIIDYIIPYLGKQETPFYLYKSSGAQRKSNAMYRP